MFSRVILNLLPCFETRKLRNALESVVSQFGSPTHGRVPDIRHAIRINLKNLENIMLVVAVGLGLAVPTLP